MIAGGPVAIPLFVARLIGAGIMAVLYGALALPLIIGLLIATNRLRYRGWLAGLTLLISLFFLNLTGNFAYNLMHWTKSRPSAFDVALTLGLAGASPFSDGPDSQALPAERRLDLGDAATPRSDGVGNSMGLSKQDPA